MESEEEDGRVDEEGGGEEEEERGGGESEKVIPRFAKSACEAGFSYRERGREGRTSNPQSASRSRSVQKPFQQPQHRPL